MIDCELYFEYEDVKSFERVVSILKDKDIRYVEANEIVMYELGKLDNVRSVAGTCLIIYMFNKYIPINLNKTLDNSKIIVYYRM